MTYAAAKSEVASGKDLGDAFSRKYNEHYLTFDLDLGVMLIQNVALSTFYILKLLWPTV